MARGVEHQFLLGDVEKIEQLEVAVEHVDLGLFAVAEPHEKRFLGEHDLFGTADVRLTEFVPVHRVREPRHLGAVAVGFLRHDDCGRGILLAGDAREHRRKAPRDAVGLADRIVAEFAVRLGHRADEALASGDAIEFGGGKAVCRQNEIGTDDARNIALESVLASSLNDRFGLALVEIFGDKRRGRAPRAALVEGG